MLLMSVQLIMGNNINHSCMRMAENCFVAAALLFCHTNASSLLNLLVWQTESYSNASHNFKVKKSAWKNAQNLHRIQENGAQNLQVTHAEFSYFWCIILTTLVKLND